MKLEETVLSAARFCLHAPWDASVDREMAVLQVCCVCVT
jgi:hypothetical protein